MNSNEDFIQIEDIKNDVYRLIKEVNIKCETLEEIYKEYLSEAVKKTDYLMSLDVLFFQIELTKEDSSNYNNLFNSFLSKMYGQYYKLYIKIVNNEELKNILDSNLYVSFIPFDDLKYKDYPFSETQRIHNLITSILNKINEHVSREAYTVEDDEVRIKKGININHLVYEKTHDMEVYKQKSKLFSKILKNYYDYQKKFLRRMLLKLKLLFFQIDSDIEFESVTHSISRGSVTAQIDNQLMNIKVSSSNGNLEQLLLSELDISKSPIKKEPEVSNENIFSKIFSQFLKGILWLICLRI